MYLACQYLAGLPEISSADQPSDNIVTGFRHLSFTHTPTTAHLEPAPNSTGYEPGLLTSHSACYWTTGRAHTHTHASQTQSAHWSNSCTKFKFLLRTRSNPLIFEARSNPVWSNSSPNEPCCYASSRCAQPDIIYLVGAGFSNPSALRS